MDEEFQKIIDSIYADAAVSVAERVGMVEAEAARVAALQADKSLMTPEEFEAHLRSMGVAPTSHVTAPPPTTDPGGDAFALNPQEWALRQRKLHDAAAKEARKPPPAAPGGDATRLSGAEYGEHLGRLGVPYTGSHAAEERWEAREQERRERERVAREEALVAEVRGLREELAAAKGAPAAPAAPAPPVDPDRAAYFAVARRRAAGGAR